MRGQTRTWIGATLVLFGACGDGGEPELSSEEVAGIQEVIVAAVDSIYEPAATLWVHTCPDFNMGCSSEAFLINGTCAPLMSLVPGSCYDTGYPLETGRTYTIQSCTSCPSDCGAPFEFPSPEHWFDDSFYIPASWYCATPCNPPPICP